MMMRCTNRRMLTPDIFFLFGLESQGQLDLPTSIIMWIF